MDLLTLDSEVTKSQQSLLQTWNRKLLQQDWKPGEFLGSDLALSEQFGVSRTVVRGALDILERAGCIRRIPRRGIVLERGFFLEQREEKKVLEDLLFIRWADDALSIDILTGLTRQAESCGFNLIQGMAHQNDKAFIEMLDHLPENCHNVALIPMEIPTVVDAMCRVQERGIRIIQIDRYIEGFPAPSIMFDNYQGGIMATRHLLSRHDGPVFFFGCLNPLSSRKRHQGWHDAMYEAGFNDIKQYIIPMRDDSRMELITAEEYFKQRRGCLIDFLKQQQFPISIFAMGDAWARQVYDIAPELGLEIGRDIFLVGYDNLDLCDRLSPSLTSISVPRVQLGMEAIKLLSEIPRNVTGYCRMLPVELKERQSS